MRHFIILGQKASASPAFSLVDLPATSGRLDVLLRAVAAALLVSHGLRRDAVVYLVLLGGDGAPRTLRVDGATAKYIRPDERSLATAVQKALSNAAAVAKDEGFVTVRPGISVAVGGLDAVLADMGAVTSYVLEEGAEDLRDLALTVGDVAFFVGDHLGFDEGTRARLASAGAVAVGIGPVSIHADHAIVVVSNELDRREAARANAR